jgi:hypothetical protein
MKTIENHPMRLVLGQLLEHARWASRPWVDATLHAMIEAFREADCAERKATRRLEFGEPGTDADARERALVAAIEACVVDDELRTLGLNFLKLREQYRPIWSEDRGVPGMQSRGSGRLVAVHRRQHDILS